MIEEAKRRGLEEKSGLLLVAPKAGEVVRLEVVLEVVLEVAPRVVLLMRLLQLRLVLDETLMPVRGSAGAGA